MSLDSDMKLALKSKITQALPAADVFLPVDRYFPAQV